MLGIVAMMMDYMLPKKVMSWREAWDIYFTEAGGSLFQDLARYGLRPPKYADVATAEADHISHQNWATFYQYSHAAAFHTWMPDREHLDWLSEKYPTTFDKYYRPRWEMWAEMEKEGKRFYNMALPQLCQTCQIPMAYTEPGDPTTICFRTRSSRATPITSARTAAKTSSTASRRSTSRRGCRCTRSSRAIAAARPCRTCWTGTG